MQRFARVARSAQALRRIEQLAGGKRMRRMDAREHVANVREGLHDRAPGAPVDRVRLLRLLQQTLRLLERRGRRKRKRRLPPDVGRKMRAQQVADLIVFEHVEHAAVHGNLRFPRRAAVCGEIVQA